VNTLAFIVVASIVWTLGGAAFASWMMKTSLFDAGRRNRRWDTPLVAGVGIAAAPALTLALIAALFGRDVSEG